MWLECELVIKNYKPLHLEEGMLFIQKLHQGTLKESIELFTLERVPQDEEAFIAQNGYPVELYVMDDEENILASPEQIGWWDEGEHVDDLCDISLSHINNIFNEYNGYVDIEIEEDEDVEGNYHPVVYAEKIVLRYVSDDDDDDDEEYYEEEEEFDN
jgi:hypothetical protein